MSKQNTLYNFFKKVSSPSVGEKNEAQGGPPSTPNSKGYKICDILWAKLDGYPYWPSIVCKDPVSRKYEKNSKIHVQFFDNPPTRAWVKLSHVSKYNNPNEHPPPVNTEAAVMKDLTTACSKADEALNMEFNERSELLIDFTTVKDESMEDKESPGTDKENNDTNIPLAKRKKLFDFDSDHSEDDYKPEPEDETSEEDVSSGVDSNVEQIETEDEPETPTPTPTKKGVKRKRSNMNQTPTTKKANLNNFTTPRTPSIPATPSTPSSCRDNAKSKLSAFKNAGVGETPSKPQVSDNWPHVSYPFLQPDNIMDKNKRKPGDADYDARTLFVPESFKNSITPAVRQWWEMKSNHYDCVLFFKVGKFYELYHMDAVIGVNELSLTLMRGDFAHSGFPEIAYGRFSTILVEKGYKVARVEQTETPDMMTERCKQQNRCTKFDKVVNREICQITTKGTRTYSVQDGEARESDTRYLLAIAEKEVAHNNSCYGVCFIDTSIGTFHIGQFTDDRYCSQLRTLVSHHPPVQILYEKSHISTRTQQLLTSVFNTVMKEPLMSKTEFWTAGKTLKVLSAEKYFTDAFGERCYPEPLNKLLSDGDSLGMTPCQDGELALSALGALVWYLKRSFLDHQLLGMKRFETYSVVPVCESGNIADVDMEDDVADLGRYMILDGVTLSNLEILLNSTGTKAGTLLEKIDRCCTFSGKRLLRQWLCSPLCNIQAILKRQEAVSELLQHSHVMQEVRTRFSQLPDLERLLGKIHAQGNAVRSQTHPDSRAIFFEDKIYSKKKIQDFLSALNGFNKLQSAVELCEKNLSQSKSTLLLQCTSQQPAGKFPDLGQHLKYFQDAFDHEEAKKDGCIIPKSAGVDMEYDRVMEELADIDKELSDYLKSQCRLFGVSVKYFGSDKNRYQLEIPDSRANKTTGDYEFTSSRKGFKRFTTGVTKKLLKRQMGAEESKTTILKDLSRRMFEQFSEKHQEWNTALQCLSMLDVLMALAEYVRTEDGDTCVPTFALPRYGQQAVVDIVDGRHPNIHVPGGFIPNDTKFGPGDGNVLLLTGPNMGGK